MAPVCVVATPGPGPGDQDLLRAGSTGTAAARAPPLLTLLMAHKRIVAVRHSSPPATPRHAPPSAVCCDGYLYTRNTARNGTLHGCPVRNGTSNRYCFGVEIESWSTFFDKIVYRRFDVEMWSISVIDDFSMTRFSLGLSLSFSLRGICFPFHLFSCSCWDRAWTGFIRSSFVPGKRPAGKRVLCGHRPLSR